METVQRGGRQVRGFGVGSDREDVAAVQRAVGGAHLNLVAVVDGCQGKLDQKSLDSWYDLSRRAVAFVSADVPLLMGVDAMYAQGKGILNELGAWPDRLKAAGCTTPVTHLTPVEAPPPPSDIRTGTLKPVIEAAEHAKEEGEKALDTAKYVAIGLGIVAVMVSGAIIVMNVAPIVNLAVPRRRAA